MNQESIEKIESLLDKYFAQNKKPEIKHFKKLYGQSLKSIPHLNKRQLNSLYKNKEARNLKEQLDDSDNIPSSFKKNNLEIDVSSSVTPETVTITPIGVKTSRSNFDLNGWEVDKICNDDPLTKKIRSYIEVSSEELIGRAGYCNHEEDLLKLLSLSSIILVRETYHKEASLVSAIGEGDLQSFYESFKREVYKDLQEFDMEALIPISNHMMNLRNNGSRIKFDSEMTALQSKASKYIQNVIQVLKSLAIQVKKPLKVDMKESQLTASFVESFFSALFEFDDCLAYNANTREDNGCKKSYRPDYKIDYYEDDRKAFSNFYCEIKPKKSIKACRQKIYKDLYKLAIFAREEMNKNKLKVIMIAHVVNNCFNFYLLVDKDDFYALLHLEQIKIPLSLSTFRFDLEDLMKMHKITQIYQKHCFQQIERTSHLRIFPYSGVEQLVTKREDRKRKCCMKLFE